MRPILLLTLMLATMMPAPAARASDDTTLPWQLDFAAAQTLAKTSGKDLFILFTGSDWCHWCKKLDEEVFSKPEFVGKAADKFVYVFLDFPRQSEEAKARVVDPELNKKLSGELGVEGFPTVVLATADGTPYAKTGYQPGGPEAYLKHLGELKQDAAPLLALLTAQDVTLEMLTVALPKLEAAGLAGHAKYAPFLTKAKELDPDGSHGLRDRVLAIEENAALMVFLKSLPETDEPDWDKVHAYLAKSKHLSGRLFVNVGFGCADGLIKSGKAAEAKALLERVKSDPMIKDNPRAQDAIAKKIAEADEATKKKSESSDSDGDDADKDG